LGPVRDNSFIDGRYYQIAGHPRSLACRKGRRAIRATSIQEITMNIRRLSFAAALAMSLAAPLAFAQADPKIDPNQIREMAMETAKTMDVNHDGMVSKQEFMMMMEAKWNEMDKDKKGMVTVQHAADMMPTTFLGPRWR